MRRKKAVAAAVAAAVAVAGISLFLIATRNTYPYVTAAAVSSEAGGYGKSIEPDTTEYEYWTEEEYSAWLEQQKEELPKMIGSGGKRWDNKDRKWKEYTQEWVDDAIAGYEEELEDIKAGAMVSKPKYIGQNEEYGITFDPRQMQIGTDSAESGVQKPNHTSKAAETTQEFNTGVATESAEASQESAVK